VTVAWWKTANFRQQRGRTITIHAVKVEKESQPCGNVSTYSRESVSAAEAFTRCPPRCLTHLSQAPKRLVVTFKPNTLCLTKCCVIRHTLIRFNLQPCLAETRLQLRLSLSWKLFGAHRLHLQAVSSESGECGVRDRLQWKTVFQGTMYFRYWNRNQ